LGEDVTAGIRSSGKLNEKGRKQVLEFLLVDVLEIEIEIGHRGPPSIVQGHNFLHDRGAEYAA
jgi:hypothetical protein